MLEHRDASCDLGSPLLEDEPQNVEQGLSNDEVFCFGGVSFNQPPEQLSCIRECILGDSSVS